MDTIKNIITDINPQQPKSSSTEITATSTSTSGNNSAQILGQIIDRARLAKGWGPHPPDTQLLAIQTWFEILSTGKIPSAQYDELYRRAAAQRANVLAMGKEPPDMSPELMLAQWPNLRFELEQGLVKSGRYLPPVAVSGCQHCRGTGFRREYRSEHQRKIPGVVKCNHPLGEVINKL